MSNNVLVTTSVLAKLTLMELAHAGVTVMGGIREFNESFGGLPALKGTIACSLQQDPETGIAVRLTSLVRCRGGAVRHILRFEVIHEGRLHCTETKALECPPVEDLRTVLRKRISPIVKRLVRSMEQAA